MRERLVEALECETVDVYLYVALDDPAVAVRRSWDVFTAAPSATEAQVLTAARDLNARVRFHRGPDPDGAAASQLSKVHACWLWIQEEEPYDWIVRTRPDLAWIEPVPPLNALPNDRVYVPGHFWPLADQFAVVPRQHAPVFFSAVDSLHVNASDWLVPGAGVPESLLFWHLATHAVPIQLYDGFVYAIARYNEGANCATLHLVRNLVCVAALGEDCGTALFAAFRRKCENLFNSKDDEDNVIAPLEDLRARLLAAPRPSDTLVVTTSGWDHDRVVGQLAFTFSTHDRRVDLAAAFLAYLDALIIDAAPNAACRPAVEHMLRNVTRALHDATLDLWTTHIGTMRCVPRCTEAHIRPLLHHPRPLAFVVR